MNEGISKLTDLYLRRCVFAAQILFVCFSLSFGQPVQFHSEKILMEIGEEFVFIKGIYIFHNDTDVSRSQTLFYPFYLDEHQLYPDSISVKERGGLDKTVKFSRLKKGILFRIKLPPHDYTQVEVWYRQIILANRAEYILTTTKYWGKGLVEGEYRVILPAGFEVTYMSYQPDKVKTIDSNKELYFSRENFMPKKNLIVKWK
ncbi:hypothetical protein ISS37_04900 [candidate division KSB1 bacterium]|nr:hypothetical protein [candidate division KSB1 bacterium]